MRAYKSGSLGKTPKASSSLKKNGVTWIEGWGKLRDARTVEVDGKTYSAKSVVIATGSEFAALPGVQIDENVIVSSTGALELKDVPQNSSSLALVSLGSNWDRFIRLGSEVEVIEYLDHVAPGMDHEVQAAFEKLLRNKVSVSRWAPQYKARSQQSRCQNQLRTTQRWQRTWGRSRYRISRNRAQTIC